MGMWPRRRRPERVLWPQVLELLAILGVLFATYHGLMWYWERTAPKEAQVPKVVGLTEREAIAVLESVGLRGAVVGKKSDEEIPEGAVLSAEPPPARDVKLGRLVRLTLSSGSRWAVVPDVREMSVDRARALLGKSGLSVGREKAVYDSKVPIGYAVGQVPDSGERVPRRMSVDLLVSRGAPPDTADAEPSSTAAGVRTNEVEFIVPPGPGLQEVRIVVEDEEGERTVYRQAHEPGERISQEVSGRGGRVTVRTYLSGEIMQERTF